MVHGVAASATHADHFDDRLLINCIDYFEHVIAPVVNLTVCTVFWHLLYR